MRQSTRVRHCVAALTLSVLACQQSQSVSSRTGKSSSEDGKPTEAIDPNNITVVKASADASKPGQVSAEIRGNEESAIAVQLADDRTYLVLPKRSCPGCVVTVMQEPAAALAENVAPAETLPQPFKFSFSRPGADPAGMKFWPPFTLVIADLDMEKLNKSSGSLRLKWQDSDGKAIGETSLSEIDLPALEKGDRNLKLGPFAGCRRRCGGGGPPAPTPGGGGGGVVVDPGGGSQPLPGGNCRFKCTFTAAPRPPFHWSMPPDVSLDTNSCTNGGVCPAPPAGNECALAFWNGGQPNYSYYVKDCVAPTPTPTATPDNRPMCTCVVPANAQNPQSGEFGTGPVMGPRSDGRCDQVQCRSSAAPGDLASGSSNSGGWPTGCRSRTDGVSANGISGSFVVPCPTATPTPTNTTIPAQCCKNVNNFHFWVPSGNGCDAGTLPDGPSDASACYALNISNCDSNVASWSGSSNATKRCVCTADNTTYNATTGCSICCHYPTDFQEMKSSKQCSVPPNSVVNAGPSDCYGGNTWCASAGGSWDGGSPQACKCPGGTSVTKGMACPTPTPTPTATATPTATIPAGQAICCQTPDGFHEPVFSGSCPSGTVAIGFVTGPIFMDASQCYSKNLWCGQKGGTWSNKKCMCSDGSSVGIQSTDNCPMPTPTPTTAVPKCCSTIDDDYPNGMHYFPAVNGSCNGDRPVFDQSECDSGMSTLLCCRETDGNVHTVTRGAGVCVGGQVIRADACTAADKSPSPVATTVSGN